jgi:hypothetical protein
MSERTRGRIVVLSMPICGILFALGASGDSPPATWWLSALTTWPGLMAVLLVGWVEVTRFVIGGVLGAAAVGMLLLAVDALRPRP